MVNPRRARPRFERACARRGTDRHPRPAARPHGFTLIELIVVMAIVALLVSIAAPRYFGQLDRSKETVLRADLAAMRDALDKFHGDTGRNPASLDELVARRYLRAVPVDPLTGSASSWVSVSDAQGRLQDVKSGATGSDADGVMYADW